MGLREAATGQLKSRSSAYRLESVGLAEGSGIVGHGPSWEPARRNVDQGLVKPSDRHLILLVIDMACYPLTW